MSEDILKRLEVLEAKDEIRELVSNYAESCDRQDLEALEKIFTINASFDSPNGSMVTKPNTASSFPSLIISPMIVCCSDKLITSTLQMVTSINPLMKKSTILKI